MKQLCLKSQKHTGKTYMFANRKLFTRMDLAKYYVQFRSGRICLKPMVPFNILTNGPQTEHKTSWRTGPKGRKYVFISQRKYKNG